MLTHWIIGAGQIGSYLAACLQNKGANVKVVARGVWEERLRTGFEVTDYLENACQLQAIETVNDIQNAEISEKDWVWLTVKCTSLDIVLPGLANQLCAQNTLICCQNGIGAKHIAIQNLTAVEESPEILSAMVPFNAVWEHGRLHRGSEGSFVVEQPSAVQKSEVLSFLSQPMLDMKITPNIEQTQWAKLQLNLGNAVNALANKPVKQMLEDRNYRCVMAAAMDELLTVCKAKQIELPKVARIHGRFIPRVLRLPTWLFKRLAGQMLQIDPTVKTSMWWDFHHGKPTEIEFLQGAVVEASKLLNLSTPVNTWLLNEIRDLQVVSYKNVSMSGKEMREKIWQFTHL